MSDAHPASNPGGIVTPEQTEVLAKLREIEAQAGLLLEEFPNLSSLHSMRINHIFGLAHYLPTNVRPQVTPVPKPTPGGSSLVRPLVAGLRDTFHHPKL